MATTTHPRLADPLRLATTAPILGANWEPDTGLARSFGLDQVAPLSPAPRAERVNTNGLGFRESWAGQA